MALTDHTDEDVMNTPERQRQISALVEAHYAELYRFAFRLSGSRSDAEDIAQQAFMTAYEKLDQLRDPQFARPWLFAIVRNAFLKTWRQSERHRSLSIEEVGEPVDRSTDEIPELTGEELTALLGELPDEFRIPLVLFYFEDMSYREIAESLEVPVGTIMSRLSRGKTYLRQRLTEQTPAVSTK